jgi:mono/diheme cytochrome c family protein
LAVASTRDAAVAADTTLRFTRDGSIVRTADLPALERACPPQTVTIDDPYYPAPKQFRAVDLRCVLTLGFGALPAPDDDFLLRASDGYVKPASGARLREEGGWLAFRDASLGSDEAPAWQPIDRRQLDPGPYYLVWQQGSQSAEHGYPWPYQLVEIQRVSLDAEFPHTVPHPAPAGSPARRGYDIFRSECIACHAINGEGGRIGPDLNVPQSIVEYRPAVQVKAYIRNPATFRYTSMPAHPHLSDADLDALVAYFETMKTMKHDPGHG